MLCKSKYVTQKVNLGIGSSKNKQFFPQQNYYVLSKAKTILGLRESLIV